MGAGSYARAQDGQAGAQVVIESDLRWRGYTFSAGHPVVTAGANYDDLSGFYVSGSATAQLHDDKARYLGFSINGGFATRIGHGVTLDTGVERAAYRAAYPGGPDYDYTQVYVGLSRNPVQVRAYFSPDYFSRRVQVAYFEAESSLQLPASFRLNGHAGLLAILNRPASGYRYARTRYDWRVGLARSLGNADVHVGFQSSGPGRQYYEGRTHPRAAATIGASVSF